MNNNQTQSTNQSKPNRFHLKTWQWVSFLIVVAVIVGGAFWYINQPKKMEDITVVQEVTITTDKIEYEQKEKVRVSIKNNLNQGIQYWEGNENRSIPFTIERLENEEWKKISIPSACGCDSRCYQEAPGIMEIGLGGEINYEWDQKEGCQGKFIDEGKYRAWLTYYNPFDPTDFSKNTFTIYSNEFTIKQESVVQQIDINKLPIISDCRKTADKEVWLDKEPTKEWKEYVNKKAFILQNFKMQSGYKVGRTRAERHVFPLGYNCLSYFDVGVLKCDYSPGSCILNKGKLLSYSETPEAFMLEEKDLENIGWLLYGNLIDGEALVEMYNRAKEKPLCSESPTNFDCHKDKIKELPKFQDGEIVLENGKRTLHRYATGCGPDDCRYHYVISITEEGKLKIDEERIYYVNTGIMW